MKITIKLLGLFLSLNGLFFCLPAMAQSELPNGWSLSPSGDHYSLGDLPMHMISDPSNRYLIIANAGQSDHSLMVFAMQERLMTDSLPVKATFYGLAFDGLTNQLFSTGANLNVIGRYQFSNGKLKYIDSIHLGDQWPVRISPMALQAMAAIKFS